MSRVCVCVCQFGYVDISFPLPQVMQGLAWVASTVLLKFMLSTVLGASDDVSYDNAIMIFVTELLTNTV